MSTARADILARVRQAAAIRPASPPVPRDYRGAGAVHVSDLAGLLTERLADYGATVYRCDADQVASTLRAILAGRGKRRILTPARLPEAWVASVPEPIGEQPPLSTQELDAVDGVITTVTVAIAQTGTLVLDAGPGQGPRALTLVPDFHLAVVLAEQIVAAVPDAIAAIVPSRPLTWISGQAPQATSSSTESKASTGLASWTCSSSIRVQKTQAPPDDARRRALRPAAHFLAARSQPHATVGPDSTPAGVVQRNVPYRDPG